MTLVEQRADRFFGGEDDEIDVRRDALERNVVAERGRPDDDDSWSAGVTELEQQIPMCRGYRKGHGVGRARYRL